ncbi:unnamed protein product, partial [Meganyctiphanes norvegica]
MIGHQLSSEKDQLVCSSSETVTKNITSLSGQTHFMLYLSLINSCHYIVIRKRAHNGHHIDISNMAATLQVHPSSSSQLENHVYYTLYRWSVKHMSIISGLQYSTLLKVSSAGDGSTITSVQGYDHGTQQYIWQRRKNCNRRFYCEMVFFAEWKNSIEVGGQHRISTNGNIFPLLIWQHWSNLINYHIFEKVTACTSLIRSHMVVHMVISGQNSSHHVLIIPKKNLVSPLNYLHRESNVSIVIFRIEMLQPMKESNSPAFSKRFKNVTKMLRALHIVSRLAALARKFYLNEKSVMNKTKDLLWSLQIQSHLILDVICVLQLFRNGHMWSGGIIRICCVSVGGGNYLRLWDLEEHTSFATTVLDDAARAAAFSPDGKYVAVGLRHGVFVILHADTLDEKMRISDRQEGRYDLKYSPDGRYLAVASNDNIVDIYDVADDYGRCSELRRASSFITHIDWSNDSNFIMTNDGAGERLIFDVHSGEIAKESGIEWASWTGVLGETVAGLWHKYGALSDINAVDANFYLGTIVTGDDFGLVKLFAFPCPKKGSKCRVFVGHSAHVTNVRWTSDSGHVVSVGGADHAVFLWKFKPNRFSSVSKEQVSVRTLVDESDDGEDLDTEDELEGIPEVTFDLEDELKTNRNSSKSVYKKKNKRRQKTTVELADDSTFAHRKDATGWEDKNVLPDRTMSLHHVFGFLLKNKNGCHKVHEADYMVIQFIQVSSAAIHPGSLNPFLAHGIVLFFLQGRSRPRIANNQQFPTTTYNWQNNLSMLQALLKNYYLNNSVDVVAFCREVERVVLSSLDRDDALAKFLKGC